MLAIYEECVVMESSRVLEGLRQIFLETFHLDAPAPDVDLVENGILDSFQLVELLVQLEKKFAVQVNIEGLDVEDLRTLERIARMVIASAGAAVAGVSAAAAR
jgi:D-alanine--poly(phosphoribitol) ligase subunit 2